MNKIKDDNYFQISGWMINRLNLKGAMLLVYAIIYGFSQDGECEFKGSRQYLCDFIGVTKPTIDKALDDLCKKNLIVKISEIYNNVVFNKYKINRGMLNFTTSKEILPPSKETLQGGSKETLPPSKETLPNNNIDNNNIDNKENIFNDINEIVDYLNEKTKKHYQNKGATYDIIKARLNDGYTIKDCKYIIDVKASQWLNTDMEKYLRPETLFNRTKFESYLNEQISKYNTGNYDVSGGFEEL